MTDGQKQFLRAYLEQDRYEFHADAWTQLRDLQISVNDALFVLGNGGVDGEPEFDPNIGHWRFTVRGKTLDERELTIMFAFVLQGVLILTVAA